MFFLINTWIPKFWTVTFFCNSMSRSLDNQMCSCLGTPSHERHNSWQGSHVETICPKKFQDLESQVLNSAISPTMKTIGPQKECLGTYRFNPRCVFPVAVIRMQHKMCRSTDWIFLDNIFQDLAATVLKSYAFYQHLESQVLNCYIFLQFHVPKSWQWLHYSRLGFPSLETIGAKNFNIRPLPRIMSFMTWSSKTWTQVNMIVKTWQPQVWNLTLFFTTWHAKFWTASLLNCMSPSLDNDYSRLGFPSLEMFGLLHGLFFGEHVLAWDVHSLSLPYLAKIKNFQAGFLVVWCVLLGSLNVIPNSWRSRSAPHATLAGRRLLHFIVWVFSLGFLMFMFMFNDCGPHSCDYKKT